MPVVIRYVWPSKLDLMARLAGLPVPDRWADWHKPPFPGAWKRHVSAYAGPPDERFRRLIG